MNIIKRKNSKGDKIVFYLDLGRGRGQRPSTGIFIYTKPKNQIEKNHNKEAIAILETKKSQFTLEIHAAGSGHVLNHKVKSNFIAYYEEFVRKNQRPGNRSLSCSLESFKRFLQPKGGAARTDAVFITAADITENLCERFRQYLLDTLGGETPGDYFMRFKRVMKTATKEGYFRQNPCAELKVKMHPSEIKDILSSGEFIHLLKSFCPNYEVKKAAVCSMYTGFRWCDVNQLEWWQVKEEVVVLRKQSKTGVPLEIPLHPVLKTVLGERKKLNERVFSLPTADGANGILKKWVRDAGIDKHITWHCLRHSVSHLLQDAGTDIETVAAFLGQKNAKQVLQTYRKRVQARDIRAASSRLPLPTW